MAFHIGYLGENRGILWLTGLNAQWAFSTFRKILARSDPSLPEFSYRSRYPDGICSSQRSFDAAAQLNFAASYRQSQLQKNSQTRS